VRAPRAPLVRRVPVGPSLAKIVQDLSLRRAGRRLLAAERFDLLYTHEEAGWFGVALARRAGLPHLYDMHSSLPEGCANFGWPLGPLLPLARAVERRVLRSASGVIAICPALAGLVRRAAPGVPVTTVENAAFDMQTGRDDLPGLPEGAAADGPPLYSGGFERNQGVELLLRALAADPSLPAPDLYGGRPKQVEAAMILARRLGVDGRVRMHGVRPFREVWAATLRASVLLSPRVCGSNAPSKLYYYMRAGRPILATNVEANRQALDPECAELVPAESAAYARALREMLDEPGRAAGLAAAARRRYEERHTLAVYLQSLAAALAPWTGKA
jgi:glycosyltransferase involved in cell wall biosynthesis